MQQTRRARSLIIDVTNVGEEGRSLIILDVTNVYEAASRSRDGKSIDLPTGAASVGKQTLQCVGVSVGHGSVRFGSVRPPPHLAVHLEKPRRLRRRRRRRRRRRLSPFSSAAAPRALARQGGLTLGARVRVPLAAGGAERLVGLRAARAAAERVVGVRVTTLDAIEVRARKGDQEHRR